MFENRFKSTENVNIHATRVQMEYFNCKGVSNINRNLNKTYQLLKAILKKTLFEVTRYIFVGFSKVVLV